jgi:MoaA/NifB/PqqE/SkfB family radical SAM enzyme
MINWELSLFCNLNCDFCSQGKRRHLQKKQLSFQDVKKIINNIPKNSHISFLWWETLMYPNIVEVFSELEKHNITYEITTNWALLDNFFNILISLKNLKQINISIDWYGDYHDNMRWKKWLFKSLFIIISKLVFYKNISISTTISENLENLNLLKLHLWLNKIWVKEHKLIYMMSFGDTQIKNSKAKIKDLEIYSPWISNFISENSVKEFYKKVAVLKKLNLNTKIKIEPVKINDKLDLKLWCKQLDKQFRINEEWNLSICEFIANSFNSVIDTEFLKAIDNRNYKNTKAKIKDNFPLDICKNCCKLYTLY